MLTELHIENLGVITKLTLPLGPGMTALTGETGAGKTMLVEAIELLVGGRAESTLVRPGASEARIEGRFVVGDDEIVLARVVPAEGRSRAYVNGRLATVGVLADEGVALVDLHGQHAHQSLLAAAAQREALDRFAGVDLGPLRAVRQRVAAIDARLADLGGDARARARELDLLRFQIDELDRAAVVDPDEDVALEALEDELADAQAHKEAAERVVGALVDDGGATDGLRAALSAVSSRRPFAAIEVRVRGVLADLDDLAAAARSVGEAIDDDPARLAEVRARRQLLHDLRRKYGDTLAEVVDFHEACRTRYDELSSVGERVQQLEGERNEALEALAQCSNAVGHARRAAADPLADAVVGHLAELAMPRARLAVEVGPDAGDDVIFLLAANLGDPPAPLAKVASGGELARAMLALRLVLTAAPDTLVFDEVDAGIGGEAALAVGRSLASLATDHQVLVVTHLAQVAAFADTQVAVSKHEVAGRTEARAEQVVGEARERELSRMLSGLADSSSARTHAQELLAAARARR
jgi:DNA repair protein RecN (Recombination protein N)